MVEKDGETFYYVLTAIGSFRLKFSQSVPYEVISLCN
jgi:hypothetical protein